MSYTISGIWYSKPAFDKAGYTYPKTWDEMLTLCEQIKKEGKQSPWTYQGKYPYYIWGIVWNMLVYATMDSAREFVTATVDRADRYLVDTGSVAVGLYRGNDQACWILVDKAGRIMWQGPGDTKILEGALARLP